MSSSKKVKMTLREAGSSSASLNRMANPKSHSTDITTPYIHRLANYVLLLLIIPLFNTRFQLTVIQHVCHRWNTLVKSAVNLAASWGNVSAENRYNGWTVYGVQYCNPCPIIHVSNYIIPYVFHLDIPHQELDSTGLHDITTKFTSLRSLKFRFRDTADNKGEFIDMRALHALTNLVKLEINMTYNSSLDMIAIDLPQTVRELKFHPVGHVEIQMLVSNWTNLTHLNIKGDDVECTDRDLIPYNSTDKNNLMVYRHPTRHSLINLKKLKLQFANESTILLILSACVATTLTSLSLDVDRISDTMYELVSSFCNLTHLNILDYTTSINIIDKIVTPHVDILETLRIRLYPFEMRMEMKQLAKLVFKRLRHMTISLNKYTSDDDYQYVKLTLQQMPQVVSGQIKFNIKIVF